MAWYKNLFSNKGRIDERIKAFKGKDPEANMTQQDFKSRTGEGVEDVLMMQLGGYGAYGMGSFNSFYNSYINRAFESEYQRIMEYRRMASYPEIADVIEDACNEMCDVDEDENILSLDITDEKLAKNDNIQKILYKEFKALFFERMDCNDTLWDWMRTYFIDGRIFYERIIDINNKGKGILGVKKLPTETMDYEYEPKTGRIMSYYQYLLPNYRRPANREMAEKDRELGKLVIFEPAQIGYMNYGIYGDTKINVLGYLEKARVPYNQLKLLETSVIIYRLIRSPERLVFKIDTGAMPRDKAMKFVEKIKNSFIKKQSYNPQSGTLTNEPEVFNILENYFMPQCLRLSNKINLIDGRILPLSEIINEYNDGKMNYVYSVDQKTGKIGYGEIEWAGITRKNAEMVRITLDNNEYIDCTPDHKFVTRDGSEIEAANLTEGTSLMPFYSKTEKLNKNTNDYTMFYDLQNNEWKYAHREFGPMPKRGNAIHHIDFNRFNNEPNNLESLPINEHITLHYKSNVERKSHIPMLEALNKPENRKRQKIAARNAMIKRFEDADERVKMSNLMKKNWSDNYEVFYENVSRPKTQEHNDKVRESIKNKWDTDIEYRKKSSQASANRWKNEEFAKHMSEVQSSKTDYETAHYIVYEYVKNNPSFDEMLLNLSNNKEFMEHWSHINSDVKGVDKTHLAKSSFYTILNNEFGCKTYTEFKQNVVINHKVVKVEYLDVREDTGCLTIKDGGDNHNFALTAGIFVKNSSEGRGSDITSVGGNAAGFTELSDIFYFSHKLFRALKYPISRITQGVEQGQEVMFGAQGAGQISRDEIKWAKFLERQQRKLCNELVDLFLLHLEFKGYRKQYNLDENSLTIRMNPPSHYKEQMSQGFLEQSFQNYNALCQNAEFSKSYLVKKYLHWTEEELEENREGFKLDKKYFPPDEVLDAADSYGAGGIAPGMLSLQAQMMGDEGMGGDMGMGGEMQQMQPNEYE